jgi:hypothetical protein
MVSPQKVVTRVSLGVDQAPLLPHKNKPIIQTQILNSLMSGASKLVLEHFWVPLSDQNSPFQFAWIEAPFHWINMPGGTWQGWPSRQARDAEMATRRWKHCLWIPDAPPECYRMTQTERRAPKLSGSNFIKQVGSNSADLHPKAEPWEQWGIFLYTI